MPIRTRPSCWACSTHGWSPRLHQQGQQRGGGDGLDIALCRVDREAREILFAGAMRPLYWLHQGQLSVINGDRKPVGGAHHELERKYTVHRIAYSPGDRIYLFSDGYVDQFGGAEGRRFMASAPAGTDRHTNQHLAMDQQAAKVLERAFLEWKGGRGANGRRLHARPGGLTFA